MSDEVVAHRSEEEVRIEKLRELEALGISGYSDAVHRTHNIGDILGDFDALMAAETPVRIAGRLLNARWHGGSAFADIADESGRIQLHLRKDVVGEEWYKTLRNYIDHGDFLEIAGKAIVTKVGERTIEVLEAKLLTKALRPLPEKWHGLTDTEIRYRHRELDLISNPEVRQRFVVRSKLVSAMRHFLDDRGFLEVETPILQPIPGGASARPFITHHNALDADLYLRIAPELYLKRLVVGGFEKIYEIGRCFRNEGIDYAHNPEFTMMELYWSYVSKEKFVAFLEELVTSIITSALGTLDVPYGEGSINFGAPWAQKTFRQAIIDSCGIDIDECPTPESVVLAARAKNLPIDFSDIVGLGEHYDALYKKTARAEITQPTWIFDYPLALKPLAKVHPTDPTKSASVQLVVQGAEIVNAYYHELNDPLDQRARFMEQQSLREQGSEEAQFMDEEFLQALEQGLPPTSGVGIGIDRLTAFVTNSPSLKEVILFPTLRPITKE